MANFVLIFHGGSMPETPEEGAAVVAAWTNWFTGLGTALVDQGNPISNHRTIAADGSVSEPASDVSGYTIIQADSLDAAVALARGCPVFLGGASIEVAETFAVM